VYVSNRAKDPDLDALRDDLFLIPFKGGGNVVWPTPAGPAYNPRFSPNGKLIAYIGHANPDDAWGVTNLHVWTVGTNGRPAAKDLMPGFDRMAVEQAIHDTADAHGKLGWSGPPTIGRFSS